MESQNIPTEAQVISMANKDNIFLCAASDCKKSAAVVASLTNMTSEKRRLAMRRNLAPDLKAAQLRQSA